MLLTNKIKYHYILISIVSIIMYFSNLNVNEPDIMESRNFITAREMTIDGNWLIPTMNGNLRLEKPPLPTWITAVFSKVFNTTSNLFILRLPAALITMLMTFFLYHLITPLAGDRKLALIASIVLATTFKVMDIGTRNTWDIYPYAFMLGFFYTFLRGVQNNKKSFYVYSAILLAASIMSKGPIALYGMFLPFFTAYFIIYGDKSVFNNIKYIILTVILTFILTIMWPTLIHITSPEVFSQVIKKEVNTWTTKHIQSFIFYLHVFPYTGVWLAFSIATLIRPFMKKRVNNIKFYNFSFIWFLCTIVLLSLIPMKKERYGLPLYIPMAIMIAQLAYYYLITSFDQIKENKDIIFLRIHLGILSILTLFFLITFVSKGIMADTVSLTNFIFNFTIFLVFIIYFLYMIIRKNHLKYVIMVTVIFALSLQVFTYRFINKTVSGNKLNSDLTLSSIQRTKLFNPYEFYSLRKNINIKNVWRVGKKLKKFNKDNMDSLNYPIVLIGENIDQKLSKNYKNLTILKKEELFITKKGRKKICLLLVTNIGN